MIDIIVLALVLGYCAFIIVHRYREAKLAARMGKIMSCAGCTACSALTVAQARRMSMGDSTGSMFYFFILILVIYFVGVGIYQLIQLIRKKHK